MALPNIDIQFVNNGTAVAPLADGLFGVIGQCASGPNLDHYTNYTITKMADLAALGIIDTVDDHTVYKFFKEFYSTASEGTKVILMVIPRADKMSDQFDVLAGETFSKAALMMSNSQDLIRGIFCVYNPSLPGVIVNQLDTDCTLLSTKAQLFCENYTSVNKSPVWVLSEAYNFQGNVGALPLLSNGTSNRFGFVIGDLEQRTGTTLQKGASIGLVAGRLATIPVQRNPGRKKDGALTEAQVYIVDDKVEESDIAGIHDKGYITFRTFPKKSGYYLTDCPLATAVSDDYHYLTARRVVDKAFIIVYDDLSEELLNDIPVTNTGTIDPIFAKTLEGRISQKIFLQMGLTGEISVDASNANDKGCVVEIDLTHPVAATSKIKFNKLQVRPKGYIRFVDVPLGVVDLNS
jgi:hypothetical protein